MSADDLSNQDFELTRKIQPIDLVKHNPNLFWYNPKKVAPLVDTLGGAGFLFSSAGGAMLAVSYFNQQNKNVPKSYYQKIYHVWGRIIFGAALGGWIGYMRFGDRQRLHNLYTADRLFRRYKESKDLNATNLSELQGTKPNHEFYRWA